MAYKRFAAKTDPPSVVLHEPVGGRWVALSLFDYLAAPGHTFAEDARLKNAVANDLSDLGSQLPACHRASLRRRRAAKPRGVHRRSFSVGPAFWPERRGR